MKFLERAAHFRPGRAGLYNRIVYEGRPGLRKWHYEVHPYDVAYHSKTDTHDGEPFVGLMVFIYFPSRDIPALLRRIEKPMQRREREAGAQA